MDFDIQIAGVVDEGFTSAEILDSNGNTVARVFELERGWYAEAERLESLRDPSLMDVVLKARDTLLHYPNRKGGVRPPDMSAAGFSFWLMQRDDEGG